MKHTIRLRDIRIRTMTVLAAAALCVLFAAPVRAQGADDSGGAPTLPKSASPEPAPPSAAPTEPPQHGPEGRRRLQEEQVKAPPGETTPSDDSEPTLGPETTRATLEASKRYADIADAGGWPRVGKALRPGSKGKAVVALRRRLAAESELSESEASGAHWDDRLTDAVKALPVQSGAASDRPRFRRDAARIEYPGRGARPPTRRDSETPRPQTGSFRAAVRRGQYSFCGRRGGRRRQSNTPLHRDRRRGRSSFTRNRSQITAVNINPTWTVPVSIIKNEMVPKIRKDSNYLSRAHIRLLDSRGHEVNPRKVDWSKERLSSYTFRQDRGPQNSLGSLRISMPNKHDVYMHDTPKQKPFARVYRFLSHGCVRVEGVYDLAVWLLEGAPGSPTGRWDQATIIQKIADGEPMTFVWRTRSR